MRFTHAKSRANRQLSDMNKISKRTRLNQEKEGNVFGGYIDANYLFKKKLRNARAVYMARKKRKELADKKKLGLKWLEPSP